VTRAREHILTSEAGPPVVMDTAHWHSQVEINHLTGCEMTYLINGRLVRLEAGHIGAFWGATPHQVVDVRGHGEIVVLYVPLREFLRLALPDAFRHTVMRGGFLVSRTSAEVDAAQFPRWHAELERDDETLRRMVLQEVCLRLQRMAIEPFEALLEQRAAGGRGPHVNHASLERVQRMTEFIATEFQRPIRVTDIARAAALQPTYAMALFRRVLGVTIGAYLTHQRLSHAQALLTGSDAGVLEVALDSGFGSASQFYAVFRRSLGKTPSQFRQEFGGGARIAA